MGVGLPPRNIFSFLRPVNDDLRAPGFYVIPCECSQVYIRLNGVSVETRKKENQRHIRFGHPDKWAVAERRFNHDHMLKF